MAKVLDKRVINRGLDVACTEAAETLSAVEPAVPEIVTRRFATTRFGTIDVDLDLVVVFPDGLIGFETCRDYVVVRHDDRSDFRWLQSLDEPAVAFPVVEPFAFRPDYAPTISDADARILNLKQETPTLLFVVVSVPGLDPKAMTANLLAPLVINGESRRGKQVIVQDEGYTTRHEILKELQRSAKMPASSVNITPMAGPAPTSPRSGSTVRAA